MRGTLFDILVQKVHLKDYLLTLELARGNSTNLLSHFQLILFTL